MVEVPTPPTTAPWQKSSASGGGDCVEVARTLKHVWVRDSKNPLGSVLGLTREEWAVFIVGVQRGEFDRPGVRPLASTRASALLVLATMSPADPPP
jgi:hypothetical protein